jgi:hypothetical protein
VRFESASEFLKSAAKAVTICGMSGVGKTTLAAKVPSDAWFHFSADYRIGTRYLAEPILDNVKREAMKVPFLADLLRSDSIYINHNMTVDNLGPISTFLGKLGRKDVDGLSLEEFKRRQALHRRAEIAAMLDVPYFIERSRQIYGYENFLCDTSGSICEVVDFSGPVDPVAAMLAEHTLLLYIEATDSLMDQLIQRTESDPKPLYFQEPFLDEHLAIYLTERGLETAGEIEPDDFARWIFPRLVAHRRPLYERLAGAIGYTVTVAEVEKVRDETDFLELAANAIESRNESLRRLGDKLANG